MCVQSFKSIKPHLVGAYQCPVRKFAKRLPMEESAQDMDAPQPIRGLIAMKIFTCKESPHFLLCAKLYADWISIGLGISIPCAQIHHMVPHVAGGKKCTGYGCAFTI